MFRYTKVNRVNKQTLEPEAKPAKRDQISCSSRNYDQSKYRFSAKINGDHIETIVKTVKEAGDCGKQSFWKCKTVLHLSGKR